jgi:hypothetical protein
LGVDESLLGGLAVPLRRLCEILRHALPLLIAHPEVKLSLGITALRSSQ